MKDDFLWILEWYNNQYDGDWEHKCGIHIETIDNPGWSITINFKDTELEGKNFQEIEKDYESANDWLICFVKNSKFEGRCALPSNYQKFFIFLGNGLGLSKLINQGNS